MTFLVLALSVIPCADNDAMLSKEGAKTELAKSANQQDNPIQDDCSPFCQCSCCAGFSINHFNAVLTHTPEYDSNPTSNFLPSVVMGIASPIWQPPQLV